MIRAATIAEVRAIATGKYGYRILSRDRKTIVKDWTFGKNAVTDVGLNYFLDAALSGGAQLATWYIGLIDDSTPSLAAGDTSSSHAGWTENTGYSETARPTWTEGGVASQTITNASSVNFTASGTESIYGAFLISSSTKGGTTGTLLSTGAFASVAELALGQVLQVTYTASMANA